MDSSLLPIYLLIYIYLHLSVQRDSSVGMAMRKMGSVAKPDVYIIKDGDTITVKTESTFKTSQFSFKLGEKFEENTLDGRKTQVSVLGEGKLMRVQCSEEGLAKSRLEQNLVVEGINLPLKFAWLHFLNLL
uniref:Fatty acid binding protein 5 n=1 Tax=Apteryx owenii TaxID=8824 RepID=A0A8B9P0D7_APTOW